MPRKHRNKSNNPVFRKVRKSLPGIGIACISACATLCILVALYWGFLSVQKWRASINAFFSSHPLTALHIPFVAPSPDPKETFNKNGLVFASFSDLFSGTAWLDMKKTSLYHDTLTTAFTYPPQYTWGMNGPTQQREQGTEAANEICINGACLSNNETHLLLDNEELQLPPEIDEKNISSITIGSLQNAWSIGIVTRHAGSYEASAYIMRPKGILERIAAFDTQPIRSRYEGWLAIGGTTDDMITLYAAYDPLAYRIRGGKVQDIKSFFGIRMMNSGFYPVITRLNNGKDTHWYVTSRTMRNPKLIKLFQNGTNDLQGALDLTPELFQGTMTRGLLEDAHIEGGLPTLSFAVDRSDNTRETWHFIDKGFSKDKNFEICSTNLSSATHPILAAKILETTLASPAGEKIRLFLSNDGNEWQKESIDSDLYFKNQDAHQVFWKATITPKDNNPFTSVYFDRIRVDYWIKK